MTPHGLNVYMKTGKESGYHKQKGPQAIMMRMRPRPLCSGLHEQ